MNLKNKFSILLSVFTILFSTPVFSLTAVNAKMGVNLAGISDYTPQFFADLIKQGRHWGPYNAPWNTPYTVLDKNGWPTTDTGIVLTSGAAFTLAGTYKLTFTGQSTIKLIGDRNISIQNQVYNSSTNTTSADVVVVEGAVQMILSFTNTKRLATSAIGTGITDVKVMRPGLSADQVFDPFFLDAIAKIHPSTLRLMDILATNGNPIQTWADRKFPNDPNQRVGGIAYEYAIMLANQTQRDIWINIPDQVGDPYIQRLAQIFKYGSDKNGTPYTAPVAAPYYAPLKSGLHVYVEYSNELWNNPFPQTPHNFARANAEQWVANKKYVSGSYAISNGRLYEAILDINASVTAPTGVAEKIVDDTGAWTYLYSYPKNLAYDGTTNYWYKGYRLTAERTVQISNIFRNVFGDASMNTTIRPVLASQIVYGNIFYLGLNYINSVYGPDNIYGNPKHPVNYYIYGLAGAPYYSIDSLSKSGPWPDSCAAAMESCTSYLKTKSYALKNYVTSDGNLYRANGPLTANWESGKAYAVNASVISGAALYTATKAITAATIPPEGMGTAIADGDGSWKFVKSTPTRVAPTGKSSNIIDGDGSWSYVYTYGDTTAEINQAFLDLEDQLKPNSDTIDYLNIFISQAKLFNVVPLGYEGGLDTSAASNFTDLMVSDLFQKDERMKTFTKDFFTHWFSAGGDLINYYSFAGPYSKSGTWGMTQDMRDLATPRMEGFIDTAALTALPAVTLGVKIPGDLLPTNLYTSSGTRPVIVGNVATSNSNSINVYTLSVAKTSTYKISTTVTLSEIKIIVDSVTVATLSVGANQSFEITLPVGVHALAVVPVSAKAAWDKMVVTLK
jgi:hypothetical protein